VSLVVPAGGVRAVIGPNGAGKSTLMNLIGGQLAPTAGRIMLDGGDIGGLPAHRIARLGVGRSFQITNVLTGLSALENVRVAAQAARRHHSALGRVTRESAEWQRAEEVLRLVGLAGRPHALAGTLSHGEQRHLEIGIALATAPRLLLLDEPTAGMSLSERGGIAELIRTIGARTTVLLVEHDVALVRATATTVVVLHEGRVLCEGAPEAVLADPTVHAVYLRGSASARTA
jgi:branched-chain amino acid transport system ATP-binding protein